MSGTNRILCVCSHNRTRSVIMAALLRRRLAARVDEAGGAMPVIANVGLGPPGMPITPGVAEVLASHGVDAQKIAMHTSRQLTDRIALEAHLILTAERAHVLSISTRSRQLFERTFTLPEFVARASVVGPRGDDSLEAWLRRINDGRDASQYMHADVPIILDPTGLPSPALEHCTTEVDVLCARFAELW